MNINKKFGNTFEGLRYLETEFGDLIDMESNGLEGLVLKDTKKPTFENQKESETKKIPDEFLNKDWDELYMAEKLPLIKKDFPDLYDSLKEKRFNNKF